MLLSELVQLGAAQNIFLGLVGEQKSDLGAVGRVTENGGDDLKHRGDSSSSGDHGDLLEDSLLWLGLLVSFDIEDSVSGVDDIPLGSAEADLLSDLETFEILAHFSAFRELLIGVLEVDLDHQVDESLVLIARDWGVRTDDELSVDLSNLNFPFYAKGTSYISTQINVLSNWESQNVILGRQSEAEFASVMTDFKLLDQWQRILDRIVNQRSLGRLETRK